MAVRIDIQRDGIWETHHAWKWQFLFSPFEAVNVQGVVFSGEDWYAAKTDEVGSVIIQTPSGAWRFYPLSHDPEVGDKWNTLQEHPVELAEDLAHRKVGIVAPVAPPRGWREFCEDLSAAEQLEVLA